MSEIAGSNPPLTPPWSSWRHPVERTYWERQVIWYISIYLHYLSNFFRASLVCHLYSQQPLDVDPMLLQCWASVVNDGHTLKQQGHCPVLVGLYTGHGSQTELASHGWPHIYRAYHIDQWLLHPPPSPSPALSIESGTHNPPDMHISPPVNIEIRHKIVHMLCITVTELIWILWRLQKWIMESSKDTYLTNTHFRWHDLDSITSPMLLWKGKRQYLLTFSPRPDHRTGSTHISGRV